MLAPPARALYTAKGRAASNPPSAVGGTAQTPVELRRPHTRSLRPGTLARSGLSFQNQRLAVRCRVPAPIVVVSEGV